MNYGITNLIGFGRRIGRGITESVGEGGLGDEALRPLVPSVVLEGCVRRDEDGILAFLLRERFELDVGPIGRPEFILGKGLEDELLQFTLDRFLVEVGTFRKSLIHVSSTLDRISIALRDGAQYSLERGRPGRGRGHSKLPRRGWKQSAIHFSLHPRRENSKLKARA